MKFYLAFLICVFTQGALAADVKISQLPLGTAATTGVNDSFPFVSASTSITKRLTLWDLINIPTIVATYAPLVSPTFSGVVTAPSFVGPLTGNASTATALAANPTDCSSGQYANAIAANGNLTCAAVTTGQLSGTVGVTQGGTGLASTTANQILYSVSTNTIGQITTAATSALVTNSSSVPGFLSASTANRLLRTDGTALSFAQVAAATDISGQLPVANGGTGQASTTTAFNALSPMTTAGDIIFGGTSGAGTRLGIGAVSSTLQATSSTAIGWVSPQAYTATITGTMSTTSSSPTDLTVSGLTNTQIQTPVNFPTVAISSSSAGWTFTPTKLGVLQIAITAQLVASTASNGTIVMTDGSNNALSVSSVTNMASAGITQSPTIEGYLNITSLSAVTIKLRGGISNGTMTVSFASVKFNY